MPDAYQVEYRNPEEFIVKDRLRNDEGDLTDLMDSINRLGLLHPLIVEEDGVTLIAGGRRLESVKRLGWTEVPYLRHSQGDPLDAEYDENVVRKPFTLGEAQEYFNRKGAGLPKKEKEVIAREVGQSLGTIRRVNLIQKIAEDPKEDESVREVARKELAALQDKTEGATPALARVQAAQRVAHNQNKLRENLLPGQTIRKLHRPEIDWPARLWKTIGDANTQTIAGLAVELAKEADPQVPDTDLRKMVHELNARQREVETLKIAIRTVLDERRFKQ